MGKKGGAKSLESRSHTPISLKEEATGKIQTKASCNTMSKLKFEHLKKLAVWATGSDRPMPYLSAFYGHQLASFGEATGLPPDPSLITCRSCEVVLQPGFNSTIRIQKTKSNVWHRRKKSGNITQNKVVYKYHFCLHQNLKKGTPEGYIKGIYLSKDKSSLESRPPTKSITGLFNSQVVAIDVALMHGPTLSSTNTTTLLEGKKRRNCSSTIETTNVSGKVVAKTKGTVSER